MALGAALLDWLFPPSCPACGRPGPFELCADCLAALPAVVHPFCPRCGLPFASPVAEDHLCAACLQRPPLFRRAWACAVFERDAPAGNPIRGLVHRFKYERDTSLRGPLGRLLAERCPFGAEECELVVPVPLHLARLRWRGFNHAQLLAGELARRRGWPLDPFCLERWRATAAQVGLDADDRHHNVRGAFRVVPPRAVVGRRVLLVDDVYTSGATIAECTRALLAGGAASVDVLVLARVVLREIR